MRAIRRTLLTALMTLALAAQLGGCGFQLRGQAQLPFAAAFIDAPAGSNVGNALRLALSEQNKLAERAEGAPVRLRLAGERRDKNILSLSGGGKVREYRLEYRVTVSAHDPIGRELMPPTDLHLLRDFSYNDAQALAKETEEQSLIRAMEQDALRQILRRLSYLKQP